MKVLYVVSRPLEINTSASIRNKATIQGLIECGCEIDLLTTDPDPNHDAYDPSIKSTGIHTIYVKLGGVQSVARIGRKFKFLSPIKRIVAGVLANDSIYDNLVGFVDAVKDIGIEIDKYDYIISSSDPKSSHLAVYELLKLNNEFRGVWVQIWGDPFVGDITSSYKNVERIKAEEHKLISAANRVIYVSELTKKNQQMNYSDCTEKMEFIPIPYAEKYEDVLRNLKTTETVELAYCGDYSSNVRNILPLYDCVNKMSGIHLTICGMSDNQLKPSNNVTIYSRVNRSKVLSIEKKADILVHLSNLRGTQIPGKIYQYSGTNKPILFILDGKKENIKSMFGKYKRYFFANNEISDITTRISDIIEGKCLEIENTPLKEFSPQCLAMRILANEGDTNEQS